MYKSCWYEPAALSRGSKDNASQNNVAEQDTVDCQPIAELVSSGLELLDLKLDQFTNVADTLKVIF